MKRRKKSKSYNLGMMALLFICAIYIIIYPNVIAPGQNSTSDNQGEDTANVTVENAAQVVTGADDEAATATEAAIAAIEKKEEALNESEKGEGKDSSYSENLYQFKSQDKLDSHFEKHGAEMGYATKEEYLSGANALISNPEVLCKTEEEDGDFVYYLESTDEIAFVSPDGYLRTYFICSGRDYFDRQ